MMRDDLYIVAIGASAGGHNGLRDFFRNIPKNLPAAFVVITHLLRDHKSELASILSRFTSLKVERIKKITMPMAGHVYVLPENSIAQMKGGTLRLYPRPEGDLNKAIDIFFESLAEDKKDKAIGIVLSGMGSDGSDGAIKIYEHGGDVLVQEPSSTQFNSMPWATIMKDHPDYILPPAQLAGKVSELLKQKQIRVAS